MVRGGGVSSSLLFSVLSIVDVMMVTFDGGVAFEISVLG